MASPEIIMKIDSLDKKFCEVTFGGELDLTEEPEVKKSHTRRKGIDSMRGMEGRSTCSTM